MEVGQADWRGDPAEDSILDVLHPVCKCPFPEWVSGSWMVSLLIFFAVAPAAANVCVLAITPMLSWGSCDEGRGRESVLPSSWFGPPIGCRWILLDAGRGITA